MHRNWLILSALALIVLLCLSASAVKPGDIVVYATPLAQPVYMEADIAPFPENPFGNIGGTFIFKGRIDQVQELDLFETRDLGGRFFRFHHWHSVCDVTVINTLYGEMPVKKDMVRVLFGQSSRQQDKSGYELTVGQEYYLITYVITEYDRTKKNPIHKYADLNGGVYYNLFPVSDGVVQCLGWKFEGAETHGPKDSGAGLYHEDLYTIDEAGFLVQFSAMIEDAKSKQVPAAMTPSETTAP